MRVPDLEKEEQEVSPPVQTHLTWLRTRQSQGHKKMTFQKSRNLPGHVQKEQQMNKEQPSVYSGWKCLTEGMVKDWAVRTVMKRKTYR